MTWEYLELQIEDKNKMAKEVSDYQELFAKVMEKAKKAFPKERYKMNGINNFIKDKTMTLEEMIYVLQNAKFDEKGFCTNVEYSINKKDWKLAITPIWNFDRNTYRIKPGLKKVPLTMQDLIDRELTKKTMFVDRTSIYSSIIDFDAYYVYFLDKSCYTYDGLSDFIFLDGSPCYKEVEDGD